jgi:hypothetical protein
MVTKNWFEEFTYCRWYAVVDNLIGGYAISNVNKFTADLNHLKGEYEIASFIDMATAEHLAMLHNKWWDNFVWDSYYDNLMFSYAKSIADYYHGEPAPLPDGVLTFTLTDEEWADYDATYEATHEPD